MLTIYPAIFREDDNDSYWVEFPDLPGCVTCGGTLSETMELATEALGLYIAAREDENLSIEKPSDIREITPDKGFVSLVSVQADKYRKKSRAVKKTLTIPEWLNEEAEKKHLNFSSVLQEALKEKILKS